MTRRVLGMLFIVAMLAAIVWYVSRPIGPVQPIGTRLAPEELGGMDVRGRGGDALLNEQKNRFTAPDSVTDLTVRDVIAISSAPLDASGARHRSGWPAQATQYLTKEEGRGVRVIGYLLKARREGKESCNGYSDSLRDYHIWISDSPDLNRANALVVEITPRWQAVHPEWKIKAIEHLASQHARVRVSGWLMWDEEHASEVDKSRGTQWEIHPVTSFETLSSGSWQNFASASN